MIEAKKVKGIRASLGGIAGDLALAESREGDPKSQSLLQECQQDIRQMISLIDQHHGGPAGRHASVQRPEPLRRRRHRP